MIIKNEAITKVSSIAQEVSCNIQQPLGINQIKFLMADLLLYTYGEVDKFVEYKDLDLIVEGKQTSIWLITQNYLLNLNTTKVQEPILKIFHDKNDTGDITELFDGFKQPQEFNSILFQILQIFNT